MSTSSVDETSNENEPVGQETDGGDGGGEFPPKATKCLLGGIAMWMFIILLLVSYISWENGKLPGIVPAVLFTAAAIFVIICAVYLLKGAAEKYLGTYDDDKGSDYN